MPLGGLNAFGDPGVLRGPNNHGLCRPELCEHSRWEFSPRIALPESIKIFGIWVWEDMAVIQFM